MTHEQRLDLFLESDRLALTFSSPTKSQADGLVILLHGGPGGVKDGPADLFRDIASIFADAGMASIRFDFRGVGESSGRYRDMTIARQVGEFEAVWNFARRLGFDRVGVIGESYGATIALASEATDPDVVGLLWPAIDFLDVTFAPFVTPEKLETARRQGFTVEDGVEVGLPFLEEIFKVNDVFDGVRALNVPTIIIHGTEDQEVPFGQSERAYEMLTNPKRLVPVEGGDHTLARASERLIVNDELRNWFLKYLVAAGS